MRSPILANAIATYREQLEAGVLLPREVAEALGVNTSYLQEVCREEGIAYKRLKRGRSVGTQVQSGHFMRRQVELYRTQLESGELTMTAVGQAIGVSREYIRQLCKARGIKPLLPKHCIKCGTPLRLEERHKNGAEPCTACKPKQKLLLAFCAECKKPYVLSGKARSRHRRNHKVHGIRTSRCPDCLAEARARWPRITVQCMDCGADVQRMEAAYRQGQQKGVRGPVCSECRVKRIKQGWIAKRQAVMA